MFNMDIKSFLAEAGCSFGCSYAIQHIDETARQCQLEGDRLPNRLLGQRELKNFRPDATVKRKNEWLSGRIAAKGAVSSMLSPCRYHFHDMQILNEETGAPYVYGFPGILISICHSYDYAFAVAGNQPIGIDVERVEERPSCLLKYFYTESEQALIAACNDRHAAAMMATLFWTCKEAAAKCLRMGGALNFKKIDASSGQAVLVDHSNLCIQVKSAYAEGYYISLALLT